MKWGSEYNQGKIPANQVSLNTDEFDNNLSSDDIDVQTALETLDDIETGDITETTDSNYVTDAEKTVIGNTSGINTGDQDLSGLALKSNVLELDNTNSFTPDADYEPATKKYVDDNAGGGSGEAVTKSITQSSHGFAVGDVIHFNGTIYQDADADSENTADVIGIVSAVADTSNFTYTSFGYISGLTLTVGNNGDFLYLSETAGELTATAPDLSKPVMIRITSSTGFVQIQRGTIQTNRYIEMVAFDFTTDTATGDGAYYYHIPSILDSCDLVKVHAQVITAGTTGTTDIQIYNLTKTSDMLTTKITIDSGETGSDTAATAAVIDTSHDHISENDILRIDVDAVSTTPAKGLIITLEFKG